MAMEFARWKEIDKWAPLHLNKNKEQKCKDTSPCSNGRKFAKIQNDLKDLKKATTRANSDDPIGNWYSYLWNSYLKDGFSSHFNEFLNLLIIGT